MQMLLVNFSGIFAPSKCMKFGLVSYLMTPVWYVFMAAASTSSSIFFQMYLKKPPGGPEKNG